MTFDSDGDGVIDKYGFSTYILAGYYEAWPFFYMDGAEALVDGKFGFNTPQGISAIQKLVDLKFVDGAGPVEMGSSDVGGTFRALAREGERHIAIQPWNSWAIATVTGEGVNHMPNVMVAEYPTGEANNPLTSWNSFLWPLIAVQKSTWFTLPVGLKTLQDQNLVNYGLLMAGAAVAVVPMIIVFLAFQQHFVKGLTLGGVKG